MIELRIFQSGEIVRIIKFVDKRTARAEYIKLSGATCQYTQLVVDGIEYNTAKARKYFKIKAKE